MACQRCNSNKILSVNGKTSDLCFAEYVLFDEDRTVEGDGYVPYDLNIGGGDYIEIDVCMQCGQLQGDFPVSESDIIQSIKAM